MKTSRLSSAFSLLLRPSATTQRPLQIRCAHQEASKIPIIPSPIPFVPDVKTFLTLIGRGFSQHTSKFPSWEALFSLTSDQLKEIGIEPARSRRYLVQWRNKYRQGYLGTGWDFKYVQDGKAKLAVEETRMGLLEVKRRIVNIPMEKTLQDVAEQERIRVEGYKWKDTIAGPYAKALKGGKEAIVTIEDGMWEEERGRKIDGGERRRAEVRFKKRIAERRAAREAAGHR